MLFAVYSLALCVLAALFAAKRCAHPRLACAAAALGLVRFRAALIAELALCIHSCRICDNGLRAVYAEIWRELPQPEADSDSSPSGDTRYLYGRRINGRTE